MRPFLRTSTFLLALLAAIPASAQVAQPPPVIERLEPTSGPPGTVVQMVGRYFRTEQQVRLAGRPVDVITRLPNRWTIRIPDGATSGRIAIEVPGVATVIGPDFRVLAAAPPPVVSDLQPRSAAPGSEVRILGENFSPRITENVVTLNGQPVVVRSATPTMLVVIVPQDAQSGRFTVRVAGSGETTAGIDLQIGAGLAIASFAPAIGPPGARVTLTGTGFAPSVRANRVFLGTAPCRVLTATPTQLLVQLPPRASTGLFMVDVRGGGRAYATAPFVVQEAPTIASFDPPAGPPGAQVRIRGTGYGTDVRVVQVLFGNAPGIVRGLTETEIVAEVPQGASTAPIQVTVNGVGPAVSAQPFTALVPPSISAFAPQSGGPGTEVVITGNGFSPVAADDRVTLSGTPCEVIAASATELRVRVPATASGPLVVDVVNAGQARTSRPFVVTSPPFVARFEPERATPGSVVTIHGSSFGLNAALVEVAVGDRRMEIRSIANDRIEAVVPAGATSGRIRVTVRLQGTSTSQRELTVLGDFAVSAIDPTSAYPGQSLTVRGTGFTAQGMEVRFAGVAAPVPYALEGAGALRVLVPMGAQSGPLTVRSADGRDASAAFTLAGTPEGIAITEVDPDCMRAGCNVVVRGYGFAPSPGRNVVTVGTSRVRVRQATPYELHFSFPRQAGTMTIRVEVRGGGTVESQPLTITP